MLDAPRQSIYWSRLYLCALNLGPGTLPSGHLIFRFKIFAVMSDIIVYAYVKS